ncbi:RnfH family protein [Thiomicrorhabdus cannonii]|uniref:RnfH family protein n=1 Tax=Thiomicrorhabdus cannonii TaxID=2748011 RepID=UPI0015B81376|nr:RnfH family protein [Thiomicrorhabdus cannonii]
MRIEVAYALPKEQFLFVEEVAEGTTVAEALQQSRLLKEIPGLDIEKVGIFGRPVPHDTVLREGDRIEVYRPLKVDPRDRRRQQVEEERRQNTR